MSRLMAILLGCVVAGTAMANAPTSSLRPVARPAAVEPAGPQVSPGILARAVRPKARPDRLGVASEPVRPVVIEASRPSGRRQIEASRPSGVNSLSAGEDGVAAPRNEAREPRIGLLRSLRPLLRPREVRTQAVARKQQLARGAVCGDPAIQGSVVGAVPGRVGGCGVQNAVKVRAINGIALSQQAIMDCRTARTLKTWMQSRMTPAIGNTGGGVAGIRVAAHYACRTRNSQKGAKISEHGKGRAIDIAAFQLQDGSEISVLKDWNRGRNGKVLRKLHASACGPFGTVLGPNSDRFHQDHFHFDTADYRSGSYCR